MSANFSPELDGYSGVEPFRFWCQKVLPLTYDDSLSYYELLCKVVNYLNHAIEDLSTAETNIGKLYTAFNELQDYLNSYLAELDIQEEIDRKLDEMALSGELSEAIAPLIPSAVEAWLNENLDPVGSAVVVDSSLTTAGAAADAKVTGLRLGEAAENTNELGTYLYSDSLWADMTRNLVIGSGNTWTSGGTHILIPVNEGDSVYVAAKNDKAAIMAFLTSSDCNGTGQAAPFVSGTTRFTLAAGATSTYTIPATCKYMYFTYRYNDNFFPKTLLVNGHRADLSIFGYTDSMLKYLPLFIKEMTSDDNIDNLTDYGLYFKGAAVNTLGGTMPPFNINQGWVILNYMYGAPLSGTYVKNMQIAYCRHTGQMASRFVISGSWTSWREVALADDVEELADNNVVASTEDAFTGSTANSGTVLKFMSYNVANYNNDTANYISTEKKYNLKKLISRAEADFICVQEDREYIDGENSVPTHSNVYQPIYPFKYGVGGVTIYSKIATDGEEGILGYSNGRALRYARFTVGVKKLLVVCTHPVYDYNGTGGTSASSIAARETQYEELFQWLSGDIALDVIGGSTSVYAPSYDYVVICGDMNSVTSTDRTNLKTEIENFGATCANGGWLGWIQTATNGGALDNIICGSDVIIDSIESYKSWGRRLYSDHYAVTAKVTLL